MSVQAVASGENAAIQNLYRHSREALEALAAAIRAGDMAAAQRSLLKIQQNTFAISAAGSGSGSHDASSGHGRNPYSAVNNTDLTALVTAVQTGDLNTAQLVLTPFQSSPEPDVIVPVVGADVRSVLSDLNSQLAVALTQMQAAAHSKAEKEAEETKAVSKSSGHHHTTNGQRTPGSGPDDDANTRFSELAVHSKAEVVRNYSQYMAF